MLDTRTSTRAAARRAAPFVLLAAAALAGTVLGLLSCPYSPLSAALERMFS